MYCQYCGKELAQNAAFCPHCGQKVNAAPDQQGEKDEFFQQVPPPSTVNQQPAYAQQTKTNTMAVVGFILSFFVTLAGLICSIIGLKQCNETHEGGKGFAIAGIVISAVSMGIVFLAIVIIITTGSFYYGFY